MLTIKTTTMKSKTRKPIMHKTFEGQTMKLRVDSKTIIVVRSQKAVDMWLERYPQAQLIA